MPKENASRIRRAVRNAKEGAKQIQEAANKIYAQHDNNSTPDILENFTAFLNAQKADSQSEKSTSHQNDPMEIDEILREDNIDSNDSFPSAESPENANDVDFEFENDDENEDNEEQYEDNISPKIVYLMLLQLQARCNLNDQTIEFIAHLVMLTSKIRLSTCHKTIVKNCESFKPTIKKCFYTPCGLSKDVIDIHESVECDNAKCTKCVDPTSGTKTKILPSEEMKVSENYFCHVSITEWLSYFV